VFALYRPNHQFYARLGIIIKKSLVRYAVDRNRLRRVIRESFRYNQKKLKGLDIIVMIQSTYFSLMSPIVKQNQVNLVHEKALLRDDINNLWLQFVTH
jgi:ribonuclease P protein component